MMLKRIPLIRMVKTKTIARAAGAISESGLKINKRIYVDPKLVMSIKRIPIKSRIPVRASMAKNLQKCFLIR